MSRWAGHAVKRTPHSQCKRARRWVNVTGARRSLHAHAMLRKHLLDAQHGAAQHLRHGSNVRPATVSRLTVETAAVRTPEACTVRIAFFRRLSAANERIISSTAHSEPGTVMTSGRKPHGARRQRRRM